MKSDFMVKTAKIIAEIRARTCIDDDVEVIKEILQDEFHECYALGRSEEAAERAYYEEAAYCSGFEDGLAEAESDNESDNEAYTKEAVESAYNEGYALGYYEGRSDGYSEGYSDGNSEVKTLIKDE